MPAGHAIGRRWSLVGALVIVLVALPVIIRIWPTADADRSAAQLRAAVLASDAIPFSGYAISSGGLSLPVSDQLSSLADLLSDRSAMRVWWRAPDDSRVDVVSPAGETDVHRDPTGTWTWSYESNTATRAPLAPLAVPTPPDLLPNTLARRLLSEAEPAELSRIGAERVAGRSTLGVRIVPSETAASIAAVDVWVDAGTGVPLSVQIFGKGTANPVIDTRYLDLDLETPSAATTAFTPPTGAQLRTNPQRDLLQSATRRASRISLPATLAGLPRRTVDGAPANVGLYGRGITLLVVVPVSFGVARDIESTAGQDPTAVRDQLGLRLSSGPLGILLADPPDATAYLLTGTVTLDALAAAARALPGLNGA